LCINNRSFYKPDGAAYDNHANYLIIKEAVDYFDARGHDFSQYDNNHDGIIDYFAVFWTGPVGNWATFWWGYQWSLYTTLVKDGVSFGDFSWQWESSSPSVVIHETGHALGVPDFYDYDGTVGPKGGVGGLDIMDGVKGDHNAFSKFMLEWLTPTIITTNLTAYPQRASAQYPDAVLIAPAITNPAQIFSEYFIVQNRYRTLNDMNMPGNGLLIWHVDARLSGGGFLYDNSYTAHKLLRLMEADGLEQIEQGTSGNAGDYYTTARSFGPATRPASARYDGTPTLATVSAISANALSMRADVGFARPRIGLSTTTTLLLSAAGAGSDSQMLMVTNRGTGPLELALQTQGPYSARDTSMSNGPTFAWIDIASSGTAVTPLSDDGNAGPYPLGFSLPLYNSGYSQLYVSMNGGITFANATLNYNNTTLPTANPDTAFIAAMWDDLNPGGGGTIRYATVGGMLVVSFLNVPHYGDASSSNTFQIILQSNGTMVLQYKATSSISSPATLGLQGQGGSAAPALQIAYSTNYIRPNLAVQIDAHSLLPTWLTCAPTVGTVPAGAALPLTFTANAAGLTNGVYTHTLVLTHNDIEQPACAIALTFVVPEPGVCWLLGAGLWLLRQRRPVLLSS
ncbi:MAG: hypothetical protein NTV22_03350, partial [bacterium]|nr:hypothetical protein [bacterium]